MAERQRRGSGSVGRLSYKPPEQDRLIPRTLEFILAELPNWRDDPKRPLRSSEKDLNSTLCDFLDARSRIDFPMVRFKHEAPQRGLHTVDLGVHGTDEITTVATRDYSIYQPFLVIEAKRLPAPTKDREREYVTGTNKVSGGIQRFRLGLHGANVEMGVIVGYIEKESIRHWHATINGWISTLASGTTSNGIIWSHNDVLGKLKCNDEQGTSLSESNHERMVSCYTKSIVLRHLWIMMNWTKKE